MQLLRGFPSLAFPLFGFLLIFQFAIPLPFASVFAGILAQSLLVILLVSRSRGKSSTFEDAIALVSQRGQRIFLNSLCYSASIYIPMGLSFLAYFMGIVGGSALATLSALILSYFSLRNAVHYSLVPVLAALDPDEEPGSLFSRSQELILTSPGQAWASVIAFYLGSTALPWLVFPLILALAPFLAPFAILIPILVPGVVLLLSTTYWLLFYLEARRALKREDLPFTAKGFLPEVSKP